MNPTHCLLKYWRCIEDLTLMVICVICSISLDTCYSCSLTVFVFFNRRDKQVVKVDFSLDIQFCQMSLVNLHWTSGNPVLHNVLLSNISICNCTAEGTYVSVIGSSSNILLLNSVISNSSGYHQGLPLISLTSLPAHQNTLQIEHCNFSHNVGPLVFIGNAYQASIINSHLEDNNAQSERNVITSLFSHLNISSTRFVQNFGTLVGVQNSGGVNVSDCLFQRNEVLAGSIILMEGMTTAGVKDCVFQNSRSSTEGSVLRILDSYSSASFKVSCVYIVNAELTHKRQE